MLILQKVNCPPGYQQFNAGHDAAHLVFGLARKDDQVHMLGHG
jgi:hypothetical protein